jgi:general secretion pathway protein G
LVVKRYICAVPEDPITGSTETWQLIASPDPNVAGAFDVKSAAEGAMRDGRAYSEL